RSTSAEDRSPYRVVLPRGDVLGVVLAAELRRLGPTFVPGFLKDRRDLGVGDEVLPPRRIPVEEHPDPVVLIGIAKHGRTLRTVLLSLLSTLGREDVQEAVEILDLRRCQNHLTPPLCGKCRRGESATEAASHA